MRKLALLVVALLFVPSTNASTKRRAVGRGGADPAFGVFLNIAARPDPNQLGRALDLAAQAGIGWVRMQFLWSTIQPTAGTADYRLFDQLVARAAQNNLRVVGTLAYATQWNTTAPASETRAAQREHYPPADYDAWSRFVYTTVLRYKSTVHHWEIWNNPDVGFAPAEGQTCDGFWCGTAAQYARLLSITYAAAKLADQNSVILLGGLDLGPQSNPNFLFDILTDPENPANVAFDVMSMHVYGSQFEALRRMNFVKSQLAFGGATSRPIWVTEFGYPSDTAKQTVPPYQTGEAGQAAYLKDMAPYLFTLGAQKAFWYQLFDTDASDPFASYGLLTPLFAKKPSYDAYATVIKAGKP